MFGWALKGRSYCKVVNWSGAGRQRISSDVLKVSEEIRWALNNRKPVVALESTIITHGMPYPENLRVAKEVEAVVKEGNCVPATIAVVRGELRVGLNDSELEELADGRNGGTMKVSRRDLPLALSQRLNGGTTVSATMIAAHLARIPIFATGGIGGVHRDGQTSLDISADLRELGRTPVTVVSAGVKSILDIGRTLEYLETEGVAVAVLDENSDTSDFPAFFTPRSGHRAPAHLKDATQAAQLIASRDSLGLKSGILLAVPIPASSQEHGRLIEEAIREALARAESEGIRGKDVTPFVLSLVNKLTSGLSQRLNRVLVKNNGRVAAAIALELSRISSVSGIEEEGGRQTGNGRKCSRSQPETQIEKIPVVVGASNVDIVTTLRQDATFEESDGCTYPGDVVLSAGGVGRNVADCLTRLGTRPYFVSRTGDDIYARILALANPQMETAGIEVSKNPEESTAKCSIVLNSRRECQILVGDFNINSGINSRLISQHEEVIKRASTLIMDANIPTDTIDFLLELSERHRVPVWYEPTDIKKAHLLFGSPKWTTVTYASPNLHELRIMAKATGDDPGNVKDILDQGDVENLKEYCRLASSVMMESWKLMVVTLGSLGVITVVRKGECLSGVSRVEAPIRVDYFPPSNPNPKVVSVLGAGDCLVAGMVGSILKGHSLEKCVESGLKLAEMSIASSHCVPQTINPTSIN